jgi:anti-anti-sigma regulatory factor
MVTRRVGKKKGIRARKTSRAKKAAATELDLGKVLTIAQVEDWHQRLAGIFDLREPISLNGGDIEKIDSAGLQLLVALMKEAEAIGVQVNWGAVSNLLKQNANQLGLGAILRLNT